MENDNKIEQLAQDLIGIKRKSRRYFIKKNYLKIKLNPFYKNMVQ